jgi:hypothetical protein
MPRFATPPRRFTCRAIKNFNGIDLPYGERMRAEINFDAFKRFVVENARRFQALSLTAAS